MNRSSRRSPGRTLVSSFLWDYGRYLVWPVLAPVAILKAATSRFSRSWRSARAEGAAARSDARRELDN